jgi:hypothetical protein
VHSRLQTAHERGNFFRSRDAKWRTRLWYCFANGQNSHGGLGFGYFCAVDDDFGVAVGELVEESEGVGSGFGYFTIRNIRTKLMQVEKQEINTFQNILMKSMCLFCKNSYFFFEK